MKDRTYEDWDDKKLALLLQEYAEEEGQQLIEENERLRSDPDFIVPESFDRACHEAIENAVKREKRKNIWRKARKSLKHVAIIALVLCLTGGTLFCTVDAFRFYILNTFSSNSETNTRVDVTEKSDFTNTANYISEIWLPDGYSHAFSDLSSDTFQIHYFQASEGRAIELYCVPNFTGTYNVDDESADNTKNVMVNENTARLVVKDKVHISWYIPELCIWCDLISDPSVPEDDIIRVAESIG